jgi:hypothetical protein
VSTPQAVLVASGTVRPAVTALLADPAVLARARLVHRIFPVGFYGLDWFTEAACAIDSVDPDLFHPSKEQTAASLPAAKRTCLRCAVLAECRGYIDRIEGDLARGYWAGVWAGEIPRERAARRSAEVREEVARLHQPVTRALQVPLRKVVRRRCL